jgi:serine/threonine protein kinase/formylglycine-generating enzyme required for sulfatase activity/dienelactone hydrolase
MIGKTLSHYRIVEKIGEGGMSTVYLAEDQKLQRKVALKFLQQRLTAEPVARERFLREARAAAALNHPNVVAVHEIGEHEDQVFIVMDSLKGQTLQQRLRAASGEDAPSGYAEGEFTPTSTPTESIHQMDLAPAGPEPPEGAPLTTEEIVDIGLQVCRGLAAAHRAGIVHRDIKPQNIHIDDDGHVRILDFGLAKLKGAQPLTMEFTTMGTVHYMSPEQAEAGEVDHRTDIWSLGVVLYQMASGRLPFRGETAQTVIHSILHKDPQPVEITQKGVPRALQRVLSKALEKDPDKRFESADALEQALARVEEELAPPPAARSIVRMLTRPRVLIPAVILLVGFGVLFGRWLYRQSRVSWAHQTAIPEIMGLLDQEDLIAAFSVAHEAERFIPSNPVLAELWDQMSNTIPVRTEPPGATVFYQEYSDVDGEWTSLGQTPLEGVRLPVGVFRVRIEAAGYEPREVVRRVITPAWEAIWEKQGMSLGEDPVWNFDFVLDREGSLLEGMIAVDGGTYVSMPISGFPHSQPATLDRYLIDRTEVTNRRYQEFVDAGGYERPELWRHAFVKDSQELSFSDAMSAFRDSTDRPGPAHWVMGEFPEGLGDHPVEAVSWYEAAAYCEFRGRSLPTVFHWGYAAFPSWERDQPLRPLIIPFSNFSSNGTVPVGSTSGISVSGASDMAGNVREWCSNASGGDRYSLGGAWSDAGKVTTNGDRQSPWSRTPTNGFRCVQYVGGEPGEELTAAVDRPPPIPYDQVPVRSDDEWRTWADRYYRYFPAPLNASVDSTGDSPAGGRDEWVSVDAPYGDERLMMRLHLPVGVEPPYQAVVLVPGADLEYLKTIRDYDDVVGNYVDFIVKSGRVLVQPIFDGTFERNDGRTQERMDSEIEGDVLWGHWVMEVSRTLDYLEERDDIDGTKAAYAGISLGASGLARDVLAVDDRFKAALLWMGGFYWTSDMDYMIDQVDCARRITTPVLMVNGEYDLAFDFDTEQLPMFNTLGVPEEHKRHVVYDVGHSLNYPRADFIRENLAWLDRYLGPVERGAQ